MPNLAPHFAIALLLALPITAHADDKADYDHLCAIWRKTEPEAGHKIETVTDAEKTFLLQELIGKRAVFYTHDFNRMAAITLGNLKAKEAVPGLIKLLDNPADNDMTSAEAARALGKIADIQAISHLLDALFDDRNWVREYSAAALRAIAPTPETMKPYAILERFKKLLDKLAKIPLPTEPDSDALTSPLSKSYITARQADAYCTGLLLTRPADVPINLPDQTAAVAAKLLNAKFPARVFDSPLFPGLAAFCQKYQPTLLARRLKSK